MLLFCGQIAVIASAVTYCASLVEGRQKKDDLSVLATCPACADTFAQSEQSFWSQKHSVMTDMAHKSLSLI